MLKLGKRVMIIGPSNSGKSTLTANLGKKTGYPVLHLDQIAHKPGTNWERTDIDWFVAEHDKFIEQENWIIEGNYSVCMPQRIARAETVIWCDPSLLGCMYRYILRSLKSPDNRIGTLKGAHRELNLSLIKYTLRNYPKNRKKYAAFLAEGSHLDIKHYKSFKQIKALSDMEVAV